MVNRLTDASTKLVDQALELAYVTEGAIRYEEVLRMTNFEKSRISAVTERVNAQRDIAIKNAHH